VYKEQLKPDKCFKYFTITLKECQDISVQHSDTFLELSSVSYSRWLEVDLNFSLEVGDCGF
jgi:hypothetical protein